MVSIFGVMLLVLASVCFPADVQVVNGFDQDVIDLAWYMASVSIVPLVRLPLVYLLVHIGLLPQHEVHFVHW